jgi:predicted metal-binding membrane protein
VLIAGGAVAAAAVLAWLWLIRMEAGMSAMEGMAGHAMPVPPWSGAYLLPAFTMWALMMVAMMLPSAAPMILLHARIDRAERPHQRLMHSLLFILGYLVVWSLFSLAAALAQSALIAAGLISATSLVLGQRALAAGLLLAAATYQLSRAKAACLDQCRSPIYFVMRYARPGAAGALRLGTIHGLYCLGCCWGLMLLLFVGGVMNLAWIALLAALVFVEKVAPTSWHASRWIAAALAAGAIGIVAV